MRRTLITNRARAMRKAMTEPEVMLWSRLRGRGPDRPTFRRQHPFGSMILDFYCPAARLAVEVDGATHWDEAAQAKDGASASPVGGLTILTFASTGLVLRSGAFIQSF
jgi:very-short-patch-repair endonuclease